MNALKRKLSMANEEAAKQKLAKVENSNPNSNTPKETEPVSSEANNEKEAEKMDTAESSEATVKKPDEPLSEQKSPSENVQIPPAAVPDVVTDENVNSPLRRGSQESTATTTTVATTTTSTDSTSSSSSDSSSSDSSSSDTEDSSSEEDENAPLSEKQIDSIYKMCIKNLEECITRFPEHFKSIYRLVQIYLNGPEKVKDVKKCSQLMLGTYTTALGNQIQGLFTDRKNNNLFNVRKW